MRGACRAGGGGLVSAVATSLSAVFMALVVFSCGDSAEPLLGEWVSVGSTPPSMTYIFEEEGHSRWVLDLPQGPDTFAVDYRVDYTVTPFHLDVGPWSTGPVDGQTLFGIVEMLGPDRFRVDFEPGDPEGGASARPEGFSGQTVTFVRKRN